MLQFIVDFLEMRRKPKTKLWECFCWHSCI